MAQSVEGQLGTVLVVEDDSALREMAEAILEIEGWKTMVAADPSEALNLLFQDRVDNALPPPDRMVTDLRMPHPRDGINLVFELIKRGCKIPVLLMSGTLEDVTLDDLNKIQAEGIKTALLKKPFDITQFTSAVASL